MRQELDEGVLLEMPPANHSRSETIHRILFALYEAAKAHPEWLVRAELACQLNQDPPTVRVADVGLTAEQLRSADDDAITVAQLPNWSSKVAELLP